MNKKFSILALIVLFAVSTTGLPLSIHLCKMSGTVSTEECAMCMEDQKPAEKSCCSSENIQTFSAANDDCCIDSFQYKKIDDYFSFNFYKAFDSLPLEAQINFEDLNPEEKSSTKSYDNSNQPPPKYGKQLLNSIHQLKIALSNC